MFRPSKPSQSNLFTSGDSIFSGKSLSIYQDPNSWHNLFREKVANQIDESIFKPIFTQAKGTPNASIKVLISMMILKEAQGLSDDAIFESCRFNMFTRSAIGLLNADDQLPTQSTYYLFRQKVHNYATQTGTNLFDIVFSSITKSQSHEFELSGKRIRMDSKLLGSNIAWLSRYELVHETIRLFYKEQQKKEQLTAELQEKLDTLLKFKANKVVYSSSSLELKEKLKELGILVSKIVVIFSCCETTAYQTLKRVFEEQFEITQAKEVVARSKEEITSKSIQSPHDTDCNFRNKDGNKVKGYSVNLTESCDDKALNLIANIDVRVVTTSDVAFFQDSVNSAQDVFTNKAENIHADGAYHSVDNQEFCSQNDANLHLHAIQGAKSRYYLELLENGQLTILDTKTNQFLEPVKINSKQGIEKWRIKTTKGYRYFTNKEIAVCKIRQKIAQTPKAILQKRNNVEASIFQLGYHYSNAKSRYRGLIKHQMWANMRCLWVNFVRVLKYICKTEMQATFLKKIAPKLPFMMFISSWKLFLQQRSIHKNCFSEKLMLNVV
jgi:hypothetical protein